MVQEVAWEKLHTGHWKDVPAVWRDLYTVSCLLLAAPQLYGDAAALRAALRQLDLAALMGGALLRPLVDRATAAAQARLDELTASQCSTPAQQPCPQLPQQPAAQEALDCPPMATSPTAYSVAAARHSRAGMQAQERQDAPSEPQAKRRKAAGAEQQDAPGAAAQLPPWSFGPLAGRVPVEAVPALERFLLTYMHAPGDGQPVIITGAMEHWPALQRWQDLGYLARVAGARTVPVELGAHYLAPGWGQALMPLADFITQHMAPPGSKGDERGQQAAGSAAARQIAPPGGDEGASGQQLAVAAAAQPGASCAARSAPVGYLAQHPLFDQIPALARDIAEPDYCALGEGRMQSVNAWLGPAGTVTPLHHDPHHNLLCQVVGAKYVRLYPPTADLHAYPAGLTTNSSQVDLDAPDPERFPDVSRLPFLDCRLAAGQMLYIPPGWWHYVKALTTSCSVSYWWQ